MTATQEPGDVRFRTPRYPATPALVPVSPPDRRSWRRPALWFWTSVGAAAILLACLVDAIALVSNSSWFDLNGTYSLTKGAAMSMAGGCEGDQDYADIAEGTAVTVYDSQGTVLSKGVLAGAVYSDGVCVFGFTVRDVPPGHDFYQVEVAQRGKLTVARDDARSGVAFSLG